MPSSTFMGKAALEIISPDQSRRRVQITEFPFLIGRGEDTGNHLQLSDPRISRQCAAINCEGGRYYLEYRGPRHGVFINEKKIDQRPLQNGDVITFGFDNSYKIIFHCDGADKAIQGMLTLIGGISNTETQSTGLGKLNLLLEATSLLHSELPLDSALSTMLDHAISITNADRGLLLEGESHESLRVRLAQGADGIALPVDDLAPSQTALRQALERQTNVITEDLSLGDLALQSAMSIVAQSLRAVIAIPLYAVNRAETSEPQNRPEHGRLLGALYLDSRRPAAFSKLDRQILDALGVEAASILDNARLVERERQRQRMEQELNIARDIQQALLPRGFRDFPYFAISGIHTPCHAVGGDYFDILPISKDRTAILVADVSGKGLGAALLTTMLQGAISALTTGSDPVRVFERINRFLCDHSEVGRYATMFLGILSSGGQLEFINAGHPSPLVLHGGEVRELYTEGSLPIGLIAEADYKPDEVTLEPGDTLVLFSDGVTEAMDSALELYGLPRLIEALAGQEKAPLENLQKTVLQSVENFTSGADQADDQTLVLVRYRAAAEAARA